MLIDWFTVAAQGLNFAILVWLLKHFLYRPVQDAITAREKRIADELAAADGERAQAEAARADLARRSADFERDRAGLFEAARNAAQAQQARLVDAARVQAEALSVAYRAHLAEQAGELAASVRLRAQEGVFAIARKTLATLASASLESRACEIFAAQLQALADDPRTALLAALQASQGVALVRTAFELPEAQRAALRRAIDDTFGLASTLAFETAPALVCGIELCAQGQRAAWTFADDLAALEHDIAALLRAAPSATTSPTALPVPVPVPAPTPPSAPASGPRPVTA